MLCVVHNTVQIMYIIMYTVGMKIYTSTELRTNIRTVLDEVADGKDVAIVRGSQLFVIINAKVGIPDTIPAPELPGQTDLVQEVGKLTPKNNSVGQANDGGWLPGGSDWEEVKTRTKADVFNEIEGVKAKATEDIENNQDPADQRIIRKKAQARIDELFEEMRGMAR